MSRHTTGPFCASATKTALDRQRFNASVKRISVLQSEGDRYRDGVEKSFSAIEGADGMRVAFADENNCIRGAYFHPIKFNPNIRYEITDSPCDRFRKRWNDVTLTNE
jgi:hypothetical protein